MTTYDEISHENSEQRPVSQSRIAPRAARLKRLLAGSIAILVLAACLACIVIWFLFAGTGQ